MTEQNPGWKTSSKIGLWFRHHFASGIATGVDFILMITAVEGFGRSPVMGTFIGAASGGVANYLLGRHFTYVSRSEPVPRQFFRYGLVAAASLGLNGLGEHLFLAHSKTNYVLARILVAFSVSNIWNFPMQRFFVYANRKTERGDRV